jgi:hypothetical protein
MTTAFAPQPSMFAAGPSMPTDIRAPQYASQATITPPSSSESPSNTSPISPRNTFNVPSHLRMHSAQIKQPKSPLYVPAVLRPTEKPTRQSPPKKNGFGGMECGVNMDSSDPSFDGIGPDTINRLETELYNDEEMRPVTGPPSRNGWKVRLHLLFFVSSPFNLDGMPEPRCRFDLAATELPSRDIGHFAIRIRIVCLFASVNSI